MPLVKVKAKHQITLPASVRKEAGIAVGDLLEAKIEGRRITLTPQVLVDREISEGLDDMKKARAVGPFRGAKAAARGLDQAAKKLRRK